MAALSNWHPSALLARTNVQFGRRASLLSDEAHDEDITAQQHRLGARHAGAHQPRQVPHLLLGPRLHHLARVVFAVAVAVPAGRRRGRRGSHSATEN